MMILFNGYGVYQAIAQIAFSPEKQAGFSLPALAPHWHWAVWVSISLGGTIVLVLENAYRLVRKLNRDFERDKEQLKIEYEDALHRLQEPPPATRPSIAIREFTRPGHACGTGNVEITNTSEYPVRCYAVGTLLDGPNKAAYAIRWEHTETPFADIPAGSQKMLNVVAWGIPIRLRSFWRLPPVRRVPHPYLVFLMAENKGIRGTTKVSYFTEVAPVLTLEVRFRTEYLGHSERLTLETRHYTVRRGKTPEDIGFEGISAR